MGESWEVWEGDHVVNGPFRGLTLRALVDRYPQELLGRQARRLSGNRFPLLTKFIDAQQPLSVQVHPGDAEAQALEGLPNGKTEAWYIIDAAPNAWVIHGLRQEVDPDDLRRRLQEGTADDLLRRVGVHAGDTIFVPAGTIHAIGPAVLLHEVQQTSDITYRLYDWNREAEGTRRELHLGKGLQVSYLRPSRDPLAWAVEWREGQTEVAVLLASRCFTVKRLRLRQQFGCDTAGESFNIVTVIDGSCRLAAAAELEALTTGDSIVIPASTGAYRLESDAEAEIIVEYISDVDSVGAELQERGLSQYRVEEFLQQFDSTA